MLVERVAEELAAVGEEVPIVHFLPWWVMLPALLACALAVYLAFRERIYWRWLLATLVVVLAPALLVALVMVSVALSELYEALPNPGLPAAPSSAPLRTERSVPTTTFERTGPGTTPGATPSPSATPSASAGARTPRLDHRVAFFPLSSFTELRGSSVLGPCYSSATGETRVVAKPGSES